MATSQIGAELAEVPFGDFIANVAQGIADGQRSLDLTAVQTLILLANTQVQLIPEITEVITPEPFDVNVSGHAPIEVTGARVTGTPSDAVTMSALQAGIVPSFYQFAEATIQLKMSLQVREVKEQEQKGEVYVSLRPLQLARQLQEPEHLQLHGRGVVERDGGASAGSGARPPRAVDGRGERACPASDRRRRVSEHGD